MIPNRRNVEESVLQSSVCLVTNTLEIGRFHDVYSIMLIVQIVQMLYVSFDLGEIFLFSLISSGSPVVSSTSACPMTHPTAGYTCPSSSTPPCAGGPPPGAACQPLRQMPCGDVVDSHGHLVAVARTNVQLPGIQAAVDEMMKEFKRQMGDKIDEIDKLDNVEKCEEKEGNKKKRKFDHEGGAL